MKVVWSTCDNELGSEMKSFKENCLNKSSLVNFQNLLPRREIYVTYLEKRSLAIAYGYIFSFLYQFAMKLKACDTHSIHL